MFLLQKLGLAWDTQVPPAEPKMSVPAADG